MANNGQSLAVTIVVSLLCGLIGGIVGSLIVPMFAVGAIVGATAAVEQEIDEKADKYSQTRGEMRTIATGIATYAMDHDRYPECDSIVSLSVRLEGDYLRKVPFEDAWGNRFLFTSQDVTYELRSAGQNGIPNDADDIVFSDAEFKQLGPK